MVGEEPIENRPLTSQSDMLSPLDSVSNVGQTIVQTTLETKSPIPLQQLPKESHAPPTSKTSQSAENISKLLQNLKSQASINITPPFTNKTSSKRKFDSTYEDDDDIQDDICSPSHSIKKSTDLHKKSTPASKFILNPHFPKVSLAPSPNAAPTTRVDIKEIGNNTDTPVKSSRRMIESEDDEEDESLSTIKQGTHEKQHPEHQEETTATIHNTIISNTSLVTLRAKGTTLSRNVSFRDSDNSIIVSPTKNIPSSPSVNKSTQPFHIPHSRFVDDSINEVDDKIIMAVSFRNKKLGCVYFSVTKSKLFMIEDSYETTDFEVLKLLIFQVRPNIILVNTRADEKMIELLQSLKQSIPEDVNSSEFFEIEFRPSVEYAFNTSKNKILNLNISDGSSMGDAVVFENAKTKKILFLESIVSFDQVEMICCAGALITYIARSRLTGELLESDDDNEPELGESQDGCRKRNNGLNNMEIDSIEHFTLKTFMHVNADSMISLQIFENESHPNMHSVHGSKEGLSLFSLLNNTKTVMGKMLLRQWFLRPLYDIQAIKNRQDSIALFLNPGNAGIVDQISSTIRIVKNIPKILLLLKTKSSIDEFQSLLKFTFGLLKLRALFSELQGPQIEILAKFNNSFQSQEIKDIGTLINDLIDFDESNQEKRVCLKLNIDEELDELKKKYNGLDDFLSQVAVDLGEKVLPELAGSLNVIYFPQLGYLITLPFKPEMNTDGMEVDGLVFQFCTASTVYYKNDEMFALDSNLGDLHSLIVDREIYLVQNLQEAILRHRLILHNAANCCAEIDCYLSLAEAARKYEYKKPIISEDDIIDIRNGRHPLQELCVSSFVPNDTFIGNFANRMEKDKADLNPRGFLLTGANFSGKSVYMKQVAIIVFMAHIGSFVPAERAVIGLTDKIFTRVSTRESVSKIQSAFMIDLQQVSVALRNCTDRSLIILDEFGKGTLSTDGVGLFCSSIESLTSRGMQSPKVIAATHFTEIFNYDLLAPPFYKEMTMQLLQDEGGSDGITFLYRCVPGRSLSSFGVYCASLAGIPENVVERAKEVSELIATGKSLRPSDRMSCGRFAYPEAMKLMDDVVEKFIGIDFENGDDGLDEVWELLGDM